MILGILRRAKKFFGATLAILIALVAMNPQAALADSNPGNLFVPFLATESSADAAGMATGTVYVLTNQVDGNEVAIFNRSADGSLSAPTMAATGGLGTGMGLGSQGAVVLSENGRWLFAVNAGSDEISVFAVHSGGLTLTDKVASGGLRPTSVTNDKDLVYVLNAGDPGNISGFRLSNDGHLTPIPDSTRYLSNNGMGAAPAPAQVSFGPKGEVLVVTERATQIIDTYLVGADGLASGPATQPSSGMTPFGFAFTKQGTLVVSEAFGGAVNGSAVSSYAVSAQHFSLVSPSVPTGETAACWVAVTKNGKIAYSANAGSSSVSAYRVAQDGSLTLLNGRAGLTGDGTAPIDMSMSHNSQYLYVLSARSQNVIGFAVQPDGSLVSLGAFGGLPEGTGGIAAR
jgi:6-phosphogluconolactonase